MIDATLQQALARVEARFAELDRLLAEPDVARDPKRLRDLSRERSRLARTVETSEQYNRLQKTLADDRAAVASGDAELAELAQAELPELEARETTLSEELKKLLLPRDPDDDKNVIVEIRGAEGGEEANLFARDLFEMYSRYAERRGWKLEILGSDPSVMGGFNEVSFLVKGDGVWSRMKHEAGVHRVQRVPVTESQGRIHTSSATVTVLPEAEEIEVQIDPNDLKIDVYRSTGPGGQSVNTTDSAVRITHLPTGVVVAMQDEKSQIQNRARAMQVLRARLLKLEQDRQVLEASETRRGQTGSGARSEKIRTYNFKENRVTDHRIGLTLYRLDRILGEGDLDEIIDALAADERARQLASE